VQISKALEDKGHAMTPAQCDGRWKTLMRGLKNVYDHNNKSGNNSKQHPYDKELDFIAEKPNVSASYVVSSGSSSIPATASTSSANKLLLQDEASGNSSKPATASTSSVNKPLLQDEASGSKKTYINDSNTDTENVSVPNKRIKKEFEGNEQKPKRKKQNEVVDVLKSFISTQQERFDAEYHRKEKMHTDRMEVFQGFLSILQKQTNDKNNNPNQKE